MDKHGDFISDILLSHFRNNYALIGIHQRILIWINI